jgi:Zn-dependent protease with chaperone function
MKPALVYEREPRLFAICSALSILFWMIAVVATFGMVLFWILLAAIGYLFVQSAFISYLRGMGVRVSRQQLPELYERFQRCCETLQVAPEPEVYVVQGHGVLNAFATRFLRRHYVALYADVIDALADRPDALSFYLGHELGHIKRGHLGWAAVLLPSKGLPLIGAAYARAREYTCDLHGLACCEDPRAAAHGLAVLAAGTHAASSLDLNRLAAQSDASGEFWMSFHELTSDYPWLTKRLKRLIRTSDAEAPDFPGRHPLAWVLAFFVPNVGAGGANAIPAMMIGVALIGIFSAIAIPNFVRFQQRAKVGAAARLRAEVQREATRYIEAHGSMPGSLEALGVSVDVGNPAVSSIEVIVEGVRVHLARPARPRGRELRADAVPRSGRAALEVRGGHGGAVPRPDLQRQQRELALPSGRADSSREQRGRGVPCSRARER